MTDHKIPCVGIHLIPEYPPPPSLVPSPSTPTNQCSLVSVILRYKDTGRGRGTSQGRREQAVYTLSQQMFPCHIDGVLLSNTSENIAPFYYETSLIFWALSGSKSPLGLSSLTIT